MPRVKDASGSWVWADDAAPPASEASVILVSGDLEDIPLLTAAILPLHTTVVYDHATDTLDKLAAATESAAKGKVSARIHDRRLSMQTVDWASLLGQQSRLRSAPFCLSSRPLRPIHASTRPLHLSSPPLPARRAADVVPTCLPCFLPSLPTPPPPP